MSIKDNLHFSFCLGLYRKYDDSFPEDIEHYENLLIQCIDEHVEKCIEKDRNKIRWFFKKMGYFQ